MRIISFLALTLSLLVLCSCDKTIVPSGDLTVQEHDIADYTNISSSGVFDIEITFSDEERIEVETAENLHQYIILEKEGNTLSISTKDNVNIENVSTMKVRIFTPSIMAYAGSGNVKYKLMNTLTGANASVDLSGAATFNATMELEQLSVNVAGKAEATFAGQVNMLEIDAAGAAIIKDHTLTTNTLDAKMRGSTALYVTIMDELYIEGAGSATLYYKGTPAIKSMSLKGASEIVPLN